MTKKTDADQRIAIPGYLADFLDVVQAERQLPNRREALLYILRDGLRRKRDASRQVKARERRRIQADANQIGGKG